MASFRSEAEAFSGISVLDRYAEGLKPWALAQGVDSLYVFNPFHFDLLKSKTIISTRGEFNLVVLDEEAKVINFGALARKRIGTFGHDVKRVNREV